MKTLIYYSLFLLMFISACSDTPLTENKNAKIYSGDFAGSPLQLSIEQIGDSNVKGFSSHKGHKSELSGIITCSEKGYAYKLKEMGTSRFEGSFDLELDTTMNMIFGSWQLADTTGGKEVVIFTLTPQLAE